MEVIAGNFRGSRGRILKAMPKERKVVVEGVNMVWKHLRPAAGRPSGGRIQVEAPLDASNVSLLCPNRDCPKHDQPVRTRNVPGNDGSRQRACARCGAVIPKAE